MPQQLKQDSQRVSKPTLGPWHRNIRANGKYPVVGVVFAGRNQHIATVIHQEDREETEANIDLIAAAPELLEALECAHTVLYLLSKEISALGCDAHKVPERVKAAIRKAKGE